MREVSLVQMLTARDRRAEKQAELLNKYQCPLICFTMNIAGPIKTSPIIERAFQLGMRQLRERLSADRIKHTYTDIADTGCEAMFVIDADPHELKSACISIEESSAIGRLFDMDVLDRDGNKLVRTVERGCIVCGAPGRGCAARRLHNISALQTATDRILLNHFLNADREYIADSAVSCLLEEVDTTPKPGLVDRRNNGSHSDMTRQTFYDGANALKPYFSECFTVGHETADAPPEEVFCHLRTVGVRAERAMFAATNGINTHKGAIYILGSLCGAIGRLWTAENPFADTNAVLQECSRLVHVAVREDFSATDNSTVGLRLYHTRGIRGVRGEMAAGMPSVATRSLPTFKAALKRGLNRNDAGCVALLHLIAHTEDTALYHRGGVDGAEYAANAAKQLLIETPTPSTARIEALDDAFISKNLSPGGCADLLAATYFLYDLEVKNKNADA